MNRGSKNGIPVRKLPDAEQTIDDGGTFPTCKIHVVDESTGRSTDLIVNRLFAAHSPVTGRATRAYLAYDVAAKKLVFLKDTWRYATPDLPAEYKTYQLLQEHGVRNIPEVLFGGDVAHSKGQVQEMLTQRVASDGAEWRFDVNSFEKYFHHRIVQCRKTRIC